MSSSHRRVPALKPKTLARFRSFDEKGRAGRMRSLEGSAFLGFLSLAHIQLALPARSIDDHESVPCLAQKKTRG